MCSKSCMAWMVVFSRRMSVLTDSHSSSASVEARSFSAVVGTSAASIVSESVEITEKCLNLRGQGRLPIELALVA